MKQKDIALIIVIAAISGVVSFVVSRQIFATPQDRQQKVEKITPITTEFATPDSQYFNKNSIDPSQQIQVGNNDNTNPFNGTTN